MVATTRLHIFLNSTEYPNIQVVRRVINFAGVFYFF
jgi:hypothetical protein